MTACETVGLFAGPTPDLLDHLSRRRTVPAAQLGAPGPGEAEVRRILALASRVPDHGGLVPWRFVIYPQEQRVFAASWLSRRAEALGGDEVTVGKRKLKAGQFARTPTVLGVVSGAGEHPKIPVWEQQLSAGGVCLNALHAARATGFSAQWLTDWFSYDAEAASYLGAREGERFAGFIHIGTPNAAPVERPRPDVDEIVTRWTAPETADVL